MIFIVLSSHELCCLLHLPVLTRRTTISARDHLCLPQRRPCSVFPDAAARSSPTPLLCLLPPCSDSPSLRYCSSLSLKPSYKPKKFNQVNNKEDKREEWIPEQRGGVTSSQDREEASRFRERENRVDGMLLLCCCLTTSIICKEKDTERQRGWWQWVCDLEKLKMQRERRWVLWV